MLLLRVMPPIKRSLSNASVRSPLSICSENPPSALTKRRTLRRRRSVSYTTRSRSSSSASFSSAAHSSLLVPASPPDSATEKAAGVVAHDPTRSNSQRRYEVEPVTYPSVSPDSTPDAALMSLISDRLRTKNGECSLSLPCTEYCDPGKGSTLLPLIALKCGVFIEPIDEDAVILARAEEPPRRRGECSATEGVKVIITSRCCRKLSHARAFSNRCATFTPRTHEAASCCSSLMYSPAFSIQHKTRTGPTRP